MGNADGKRLEFGLARHGVIFPLIENRYNIRKTVSKKKWLGEELAAVSDMGLYPDNTEGAVLYNGVSQRRIDRYALRRCRVGITEQEPPIVGGTILDNLTLLSDDFEADKLNRMLAILGLDKMIAAAENGAAAMLGSKKGGVSGGEKQNIAIVRQMLKSPDVMLFLESTSALDAKSRSALIKLLHEVKRDHIVIVVTHDEEMLAACDEVIPMPGCLSGRGVEGPEDRNGVGVG